MLTKAVSILGHLLLAGFVFSPTIAAFGFASWIVWSSYIGPGLRSAHSAGWIETPCIMQDIDLVITGAGSGSRRRKTERVRVHYSYIFEGQSYSSNRFDFFSGEVGSFVEPNRQYVQQHPIGSRTTCYVDPDNPTEAVLLPRRKVGIWLGVLAAVLVMGGLLIGRPIFIGYRAAMGESAVFDEEAAESLRRIEARKAAMARNRRNSRARESSKSEAFDSWKAYLTRMRRRRLSRKKKRE